MILFTEWLEKKQDRFIPVEQARLPFTGGYPEDHCPECGHRAIAACRCRRNDRWCQNGHVWERLEDGRPVLLDKGHGQVIKTY